MYAYRLLFPHQEANMVHYSDVFFLKLSSRIRFQVNLYGVIVQYIPSCPVYKHVVFSLMQVAKK
jgi:TRAP-type mannitol/chloroaromatic compound transport system permease small subunit